MAAAAAAPIPTIRTNLFMDPPWLGLYQLITRAQAPQNESGR
jgi:hypothetical protein